MPRKRIHLPMCVLAALVWAGCNGPKQGAYLLSGPKGRATSSPASRPAMQLASEPATQPAPLPEAPVAPADQQAFDEALARISRREYDRSRPALARLLGQFEQARSDRHVAATMFWLGYVAEKQQRWSDARAWYRRLNDRYPDSRPARQGLRRLDDLDRNAPGDTTTAPASRPAER